MRGGRVPRSAVAALLVPVLLPALPAGPGGAGAAEAAEAAPARPAQEAPAADAGRGAGAGLDWGACGDLDPGDGPEPECATLDVPMDTGAQQAGTARDEAATVQLALSRVPATGTREGVLFVNPGGPGSPGRIWASHTAGALPADLREHYDVIGFDPRGSGASTPGISCDPGYFTPVRPDTVPASRADEAHLVDRAKDYAGACTAPSGLLDHMRTTDIAADMDRIRAAVGAEQIDYLGYSFGTLLGGVYATLYPERVDRMVLDSVVHPDRPWYASNLAQSRALDGAGKAFFDWAARHDAAYGLGTDGAEVEAAYQAIRAELAEQPLAQTVGPTELENAAITAAYTTAVWPDTARALADYASGADPEALVRLHERFGDSEDDDAGYGAYLATECTDSPWPADWATWSRDGRAAHAEAPFQGWNNIWYNAPCAFWPSDAGPWTQVDGSGTGGALLIQATGDGATPQDGAFAMRERFPGGRLVLQEDGYDHGVSFGGDECVDGAVLAYLRDGTLPDEAGGGAADLVCQAPPLPEPDGGGREPQSGQQAEAPAAAGQADAGSAPRPVPGR
ncbi:alpha/beta hydrolase [Nocardiopsis coralliicola]